MSKTTRRRHYLNSRKAYKVFETASNNYWQNLYAADVRRNPRFVEVSSIYGSIRI